MPNQTLLQTGAAVLAATLALVLWASPGSASCAGSQVTSGASVCYLGGGGGVTGLDNNDHTKLVVYVCDSSGDTSTCCTNCGSRQPIFCWGLGWNSSNSYLGKTSYTYGDTLFERPCAGGSCSGASVAKWQVACDI